MRVGTDRVGLLLAFGVVCALAGSPRPLRAACAAEMAAHAPEMNGGEPEVWRGEGELPPRAEGEPRLMAGAGGGGGVAVEEGYLPTPDGARIFYRMLGSGPDTLIAIHGGPGVDLESIAGDFAPLFERHTVLFYDQRGAGRSTLPEDRSVLNADQQILDLETVRRHFGLDRVTLVAHSYGPLLAATYALSYPERVEKMVFFGPVPPYRGDFWQRFGDSLGDRLDSDQLAALGEAQGRLADPAADPVQACRDYWSIALLPRLAEPERTLPLLRSDLCASDPEGIRFGLTVTNAAVMGSYGDWDLREALRGLTVPTLIVHGEEESIPMDMVEVWAQTLPEGELLRVPRAAHFSYAERPEVVWPAVEAFLDR